MHPRGSGRCGSLWVAQRDTPIPLPPAATNTIPGSGLRAPTPDPGYELRMPDTDCDPGLWPKAMATIDMI